MEAIRREIRAALDAAQMHAGARAPGFSEPVYSHVIRYATIALKDAILKKHLRSSELYSIFYRELSRVTYLLENAPSSDCSLRQFIGDDGIKETEDSVVRILESIPRPYVAYFWLPGAAALGMSSAEVAPGIRFIDANSTDAPVFSRSPAGHTGSGTLLTGLMSLTPAPAGGALQAAIPTPPRYYLAIEGSGYSNGALSSPTNQLLIAKMKHVISLGETIQGLVSGGLGNEFSLGPLGTFHVYDATENKPEKVPIPESMARYLANVDFLSTKWLSEDAPIRLLSKALDEQPTAERMFQKQFSEVANAISADAKEVLTAAEWAFDASAEKNETLSYLYTAIGLEAALGSDEKRVVESLSDRLSYLVGNTRTEREQIREQFSRFYVHRSKIVHGRVAQLRDTESDLLNWGRKMLYRAIARELSLIDPAI